MIEEMRITSGNEGTPPEPPEKCNNNPIFFASQCGYREELLPASEHLLTNWALLSTAVLSNLSIMQVHYLVSNQAEAKYSNIVNVLIV